MYPRSEVAWPQAWERNVGRYAKGAEVILGLFGTFALLGLLMIVFSENPAIGYLPLLLFPSCVFLAYGQWVTWVDSRRMKSSLLVDGIQTFGKHSAVLIPYAKRGRVQRYSLSASSGIFLISLPILAAHVDESTRFLGIPFAVFAWLAIVIIWHPIGILLSGVFRRRKELGVGLDVQGIYYWDWFGCCFFSWDSITVIEPNCSRDMVVELTTAQSWHEQNLEENWFGRQEFYRERQRKIKVGFLAVNPAVSYEAIRFYYKHPELRDELGTDAGVERIRNCEFTTS